MGPGRFERPTNRSLPQGMSRLLWSVALTELLVGETLSYGPTFRRLPTCCT